MDENLGLRVRKVGDNYVATSDAGSWCFLTEQELHAIGKGELSAQLKAKLEDNELIKTEKNQHKIIERYKNKYRHLFQGASLHIMVLTLRCNQKCVYCHAGVCAPSSTDTDMDLETAKKTIDFILESPSNNLTIEFQGGEPLLRYDLIKEIIKYAKSKNTGKKLHFALVTNLLLMDEEKLKFCIDEGIGVCTSLDGPKEVHDKNRGNYDQLIEKIKLSQKILSSKNRPLDALMVTTKNSLGFHKEIVDEYLKNNFRFIQIKPLNRLGFAVGHWQNIAVSAEEYTSFWKQSMDYILELNLEKGPVIHELLSKLIAEKILNIPSQRIYLDLISPCGAGIGQLAYNYDGKIYSCDEARMLGDSIFMLGDVHKDKYSNLICSDKCCELVASSVNDTQFCDYCAYKPYCGLCPVCNYAQFGTVVADLANDFRCKTLRFIFDYIFEKIKHPKYKEIFLYWANS
ncbi:MAG: His-Xaa-Ser system radical SAM maturase HxsB [Nanoarchaeota archaeon]|nr:His-Xaa-Ser system radical SAM maturase HxsB [Nanoarchaeota archaeon]